MSEKVTAALKDVYDAVDGIHEIVKKDIVKYSCHAIKKDHVQDIFKVLSSVKIILQSINIESKAFEQIYAAVSEMLVSYDLCRVSERFEEELLPLFDELLCELEYALNPTVPNGKRTIKVKYVDFYPEFEPTEHWLYKLLTKKYNVVFSDNPDYLFFSCFGCYYLQYDCIRIFISNEAVYPNLNLYDYAVTYADFAITDRLLPNRDAFEDLKRKRIAENKDEARKLLKDKTEFCNFVYSNEYGDPFREELFGALNRYRPILSGGRFLNNIGYLVEDKAAFQSKFKFSIACENSFYKGYTTEKIIDAFNAGTIPIYWGNPDVADWINPKAMINCHEYPDLQSVVEEVKRLNEDEDAYLEKLTQPILRDDSFIENYLAEREKFIYAIIDQPYAKAYRRNRCLRGQYYNDWFCNALGFPNEWFSEEKGYFVKKREPRGQTANSPLVSILIPVYNRRELVKESIESALSQTWENTEIIVVDNCSTDGTYEELCRCYGDNTKIRLYQNSSNIGPVNNWKVCLEKASGKYVKILFSDDLIGPEFIEKCVNVMEQDDSLAMAYSSCYIFEGNNKNIGSFWYVADRESGRYDKQVFYQGMFSQEESLPVSPGCALFRREDVVILDDIPNDMGLNCNATGAGIDLLIFLNALSKYDNYYYFKETMSFFRSHAGSCTIANNLVREYNLAKAYFCQVSEDAREYLTDMKMRILRDEGVKEEHEGLEILTRYLAKSASKQQAVASKET